MTGRLTYADLDEFYDELDVGEARRCSPEVDYGVLWTERRPWPVHRVSWVEATGELYTYTQADIPAARVDVVGVIPSRAEVEAVLEGWADACGNDGLDWIRARLAGAGFDHVTDELAGDRRAAAAEAWALRVATIRRRDPVTCPHCGSTDVDRGATGLDQCRDCDGLSRGGLTPGQDAAKAAAIGRAR